MRAKPRQQHLRLPADQKTAILAWLKRGYTLSALMALDRFGCMRLAARIYELRHQGYRIESVNARISSGKRIGIYYLKP